MSDISEREKQLLRREGFIAGAHRWVGVNHPESSDPHPFPVSALIERDAKEKFPLPRTTKPRERTDSDGATWRIANGRVEWSRRMDLWPRWYVIGNSIRSPQQPDTPSIMLLTVERLDILTDLRANPTETAEGG